MDWIFGVMPYGDDNVALAKDFHGKILKGITTYKIPVITLSKDTSKEAVCQIFENVNTGGSNSQSLNS